MLSPSPEPCQTNSTSSVSRLCWKSLPASRSGQPKALSRSTRPLLPEAFFSAESAAATALTSRNFRSPKIYALALGSALTRIRCGGGGSHRRQAQGAGPPKVSAAAPSGVSPGLIDPRRDGYPPAAAGRTMPAGLHRAWALGSMVRGPAWAEIGHVRSGRLVACPAGAAALPCHDAGRYALPSVLQWAQALSIFSAIGWPQMRTRLSGCPWTASCVSTARTSAST